jgi:hypothetical protein
VQVVDREALGPSQLLVKKGQLLVELALVLRELVEPCSSLGVGGAVAWCWLRFGAARR